MRRRTLLTAAAAAVASFPMQSMGKGQNKLIGLSLPLTGNQSDVAIDLQRGYGLALQGTGSDLRLQVLDDAGDASRTAANVAALASNSSVIALSGLVGTPHAEKALPIATAGGLPVVGIRSGAKSCASVKAGSITCALATKTNLMPSLNFALALVSNQSG